MSAAQMLLRPLPGVDRSDLLSTLERLQLDVGNVRSNPAFSDWLSAYNRWTNDAIRALRGRVSRSDIDRLVLTKRYWTLLTRQAAPGMLEVELDEREADFEEAVTALRRQIEHWSRPGVFVVPDTSVCYNADKLREWDVGGVLGTRHAPVHLLFPMVVIDELDRLKESRDNRIRYRASYTLAVLDDVLSHGRTGRVRAEDFSALDPDVDGTPRGEVTVEIVLDPPGHARLPIADDEIIDRALAIQGLAGREVTLITYDTGQSHRARNAGLKDLKLTRDLGDEPEPSSRPAVKPSQAAAS